MARRPAPQRSDAPVSAARGLLLAILLGLLVTSLPVGLEPVTAGRRTVRVLDHTSTAWAGVIPGVTTSYQPYRDLVYVRKPEGCPTRDRPYAIVVCSVPDLLPCPDDPPGVRGCSGMAWRNRILLTDTVTERGRFALACHEFLHALALIDGHPDLGPDSCFRGGNETPGVGDAAALAASERRWAKRHDRLAEQIRHHPRKR